MGNICPVCGTIIQNRNNQMKNGQYEIHCPKCSIPLNVKADNRGRIKDVRLKPLQ